MGEVWKKEKDVYTKGYTEYGKEGVCSPQGNFHIWYQFMKETTSLENGIEKENGMGIEKEDDFEKAEVSGVLDAVISELKTIITTEVILSLLHLIYF